MFLLQSCPLFRRLNVHTKYVASSTNKNNTGTKKNVPTLVSLKLTVSIVIVQLTVL